MQLFAVTFVCLAATTVNGLQERKDKLEKLSTKENVVLGMTAGCGSKVVNYPLLVLKNYSQQGLGMPSLKPWKLYRGLPTAMLSLGSTTSIQFGFAGFFQKSLRRITPNDNFIKAGGSFLGGLASGVPCSVWELTMINQQRFGGSLLGTPIRIVQNHGMLNLFRGITMTLGREACFTLAMLALTPMIQQALVKKFPQLPSSTALAAGALSGAIFSATITHPMDTIKTCLQGDLAGHKYRNTIQTYSRLCSDAGGFTGLFKGLEWRIGLIATTFFLVNDIKDRLAPRLFPEESIC